jgi:hydrogenase maturation protease
MTCPRILIAGVGNIFLGDDAFGVEVAQRLARRPQTDAVCVADFGIRGLDLAYALHDGYEVVILVDAAPRGGAPGTLYVIEPEPPGAEPAVLDAHGMDPTRVLRLAAALGDRLPRVLVVGCEPGPAGSAADMAAGLSDAVRAAVEEAVPLVESLARELLAASRGEGTNAHQPSGRSTDVENSTGLPAPGCR